jgi:hypothetical protein
VKKANDVGFLWRKRSVNFIVVKETDLTEVRIQESPVLINRVNKFLPRSVGLLGLLTNEIIRPLQHNPAFNINI